MNIQQQIDEFANFARLHAGNGSEQTIDELYSQWRRQSFKDVDALAIKASLNDLANGERGQPIDQFLAKFDNERQ